MRRSLCAKRVDLVIEFQVEQEIAPMIADKIAAANIPLIAIDIPHPHATYFGVDNYRVGFDGGGDAGGRMRWSTGAARWTGCWGSTCRRPGNLVQSRITGAFEGVKSMIPDLPVESFVRIDGRGFRDKSQKLISDFLQRHPKDKHILIAAAKDTSALGAMDAVRETKREKHVAIVGQDCDSGGAGGDAVGQEPADRVGFARDELVWAESDASGAGAVARADGAAV